MSNQLAAAAQAVIERWDTRWSWKDQGPTADLIHALRLALAAHEAAKPAMSPKPVSGTSLPPPDMTMPSIAPDGPEGSHFYRASTVRRLLENQGESA